MSDAQNLVRDFIRAISPADPQPDRIRELLAPDAQFVDSLMPPMESAEAFIAAITQAVAGGGPPITSTVQDVVGDGDLVAARVLVEVAGTAIPYAQWFWLDGDRITRVEVVYDPRPYLAMAPE